MRLDLEAAAELLYGPAQPLMGSPLDDEQLIEAALRAFEGQPFCIVRAWMIIDVMLSDSSQRECEALGMQPVILYAQNVILDSRNRFKPGGCVISTYQVAQFGYFFESKNTTYLLAGRGCRKYASFPAVAALEDSI